MSRPLIFVLVVLFLLFILWDRLRIHVVIPLSLGQALIVFGALALVLFLGVDHLVNRRRD